MGQIASGHEGNLGDFHIVQGSRKKYTHTLVSEEAHRQKERQAGIGLERIQYSPYYKRMFKWTQVP